jgi:hypothetical protein
MGLATHLGPWLLGTIKNTTGTTVGTNVRNVGPTTLTQFARYTYADCPTTGKSKNLFVIPAGSLITYAGYYLTTGFNAGTAAYLNVGTTASSTAYSINANSYDMQAAASTFSSGFPVSASSAATTAAAQAMVIGTSDVQITANINFSGAAPTAGSVLILFSYVLCNPDGTYTPTSATGP